MTKTTAPFLIGVLLVFGTVDPAAAQESRTEGWVFGLDFGGASVSFRDGPYDRGPLVGGRIGYGVNRVATLYAAAYEADVEVGQFDAFEKVTYGHADFGVRLHWPDPGRRWVPYGDIAMTFRPVSDVEVQEQRTTSDFSALPSFSFGVGLAFYVSTAWAFDVNLKGGDSAFKDVEIDNLLHDGSAPHSHTFVDIATSSARLTGGISWWPSRTRTGR